jgi:hypothetical protein
MRDYRAFELGPDGQITSRFDFSARDDEAAKAQARKVASGDGLELWRHDRKVALKRTFFPDWAVLTLTMLMIIVMIVAVALLSDGS